jgi:hypothetical protein
MQFLICLIIPLSEAAKDHSGIPVVRRIVFVASQGEGDGWVLRYFSSLLQKQGEGNSLTHYY